MVLKHDTNDTTYKFSFRDRMSSRLQLLFLILKVILYLDKMLHSLGRVLIVDAMVVQS